MVTKFEGAVYEYIEEYDFELMYSTITKKWHIFDRDTGLRVHINGNAFDSIPSACRWFLEHVKYMDRYYLGKGITARAYERLLKTLHK
jgi:hypothetical protein